MSAWAIINAMAGLGIKNGEFMFVPKINKDNYKLFFAVPECYGHFIRKGSIFRIDIVSGKLNIDKLEIKLPAVPENAQVLVNGETPNFSVVFK